MCRKFNDIQKEEVKVILNRSYLTCKLYIQDLLSNYNWSVNKIEQFLSGKSSNSKVRFCREVILASLQAIRGELEGSSSGKKCTSKDSEKKVYFHSDTAECKSSLVFFRSGSRPREETIPCSYNDDNYASDKQSSTTVPVDECTTTRDDTSLSSSKDMSMYIQSTPTENRFERNTMVIHSTPEYSNTICPNLRKEKWCFNTSKCPYLHPPSCIVCIEWMDSGICEIEGCSAQHPNETTVDKIKGFAWKRSETVWHINVTDQMKEDCVYACPPDMMATACPNGGMCDILTCRMQHKQSIEVHKTKTKGYIVDVTSNSYYYNKVIHDMKTQSTTHHQIPHVIKVEMIVNKKLETKYQEYFDTKRKEKKARPTEITAYHGTTREAIESIVRKGFNLDKVKRSVYGKGMYCAQDPNVSMNYTKGSGKLLVVLLCTEGLKYVSDKRYYVVKETDAMLPTFIVTFDENC